MTKFHQTAETLRILAVFNDLRKRREISGVDDFASKCGYNRSAFSTIKNGKRNAPLSLIYGAIMAFNVSKDYIFDGVGEMYLNPPLSKQAGKTEVIEAIFRNNTEKAEIPKWVLELRFEEAIKDDYEFLLAFHKIRAFKTMLNSIDADYEELYEKPFNKMLQKISKLDLPSSTTAIAKSANYRDAVISYNEKISSLFQSMLSYPGKHKFHFSHPPQKKTVEATISKKKK